MSTSLPVTQIAAHSRVETLIPNVSLARKQALKQTAAERIAALENSAIAAERHSENYLFKLRAIVSIQSILAVSLDHWHGEGIDISFSPGIPYYHPDCSFLAFREFYL
jgi:hypothetical protein